MKRKKYTINDLINLAEKIKDENLKNKVIEFLKDPVPTHPEMNRSKFNIENSPASVNYHHKYSGGLIEHTFSVTNLAIKISEALKKTYGIKINKDLVIAGALLHDIMKPYNYELDENKNLDHTDIFGLDHLTLCVAELYKRNYPLDLIKIVASHHGEHSSTKPGSIEAYIVHFADYIDSEINNVAIKVVRSRAKEMNIDENEIYERITPLFIYNLRSKEGKRKTRDFLFKEFLSL